MRKPSLFPLLLTVFIDLVGLSIVVPILPALFVDPASDLLSPGTSDLMRTQLLGLMLGIYPLVQIFSAPLLGALADKYGRKPVLLVSLIGTFIGHVIFAAGIGMHSVWILFIGRVIDGVTGGNISVAMSAIADVSDEKTRAKNFGLIGMTFGLGFIIGPYLGGRMSDPSIVSWFDFSTPFWFAAVLTLINVVWLALSFRETLKERRVIPVTVFTGAKNIVKAFRTPRVGVVFAIVFLLTVGFNFFAQFFQVYLIDRFHTTTSQIGDMFGFVGLCIALTQGIATQLIARKWGPEAVMLVGPLGVALALLVVPLPSTFAGLFLVLPFIAFFQGITMPNLTSIVSSQADASSQGEMFGMNQSVTSLAQALPPIVAGFIAAYDARYPLFAGALLTLAGWAVYAFLYPRTPKEKFHEV